MELFSIFGCTVHAYGVCIALGVLTVWYLLQKDPTIKKYLTTPQISDFFTINIITGVAGGRLLFCMTNSITSVYDILHIWHGGFSILGTVIAVILSTTFFILYHAIPFWDIADSFALYAPLLHSIARIGCLLTGCCGGISGHPTQVYSIVLMALLFSGLLCVKNKVPLLVKKGGILFALYLMGSGLERYSVDFFRAERSYIYIVNSVFSVHQCIAFTLVLCGIGIFIYRIRLSHESIHLH